MIKIKSAGLAGAQLASAAVAVPGVDAGLIGGSSCVACIKDYVSRAV